MSKIRFTRGIRGDLHVQVPVHTNAGLRTAAISMLLQNPEQGFSPDEAKAAVKELFKAIGETRTAAGKREIGGTL